MQFDELRVGMIIEPLLHELLIITVQKIIKRKEILVNSTVYTAKT